MPGAQQYDYPLHKASVVGGGSTTVTVAPGAQTGLFASVGRLDPHSYRPNEFFANNWVYEGLVAYGANGNIEASLATAWTSEETSSGGETWRFTLREGKNRQIRRVCDAAGLRVVDLERVRVGGCELGDLPEGAAKAYGDYAFVRMMWLKITSVYAVVTNNRHALFQDADVVWFRDPIASLKAAR